MFNLSIKNKILLFIITLFSFAFVGFLSVFINFQHKKMQEMQTAYLLKVRQSYEKNIELHLKNHYKHMLDDFLTKEVIKEVASQNREALLKITQEKYLKMIKKDNNIFQVHFHKKDGKTLLRLHNTASYDDDIAKIRVMPRTIHKEHREIAGFELGKSGIAYRVFKPIFYENNYVGAVEFGISPKKILDLVTYFNKTQGALILNDINEKGASVQFEKISNEGLKHLVGEKLSDMKAQNLLMQDDEYYAVYSFDILDYSNKHIGQFLFFDELTTAYKEYKKYLILYFVNFAIVFVFLIFVINIGFSTITKRLNESNKKLQESHDELEAILSTTKDGIAILDLQTNFLFFNNAYLKMTGFTKEELFASSCASLSTPDDLPRAQKAIQEVLEKGFIENFEKTCIVKNGKRLDVNMSIALMPDKKRLLISVKNITEFKIKEMLLQEYVSLIDKNIIISSTDTEGNITHVSEKFCAISGYSKEELLGKNHRIIKHPDMPNALYEELWQTIIQNKTWNGEIKNLKKDGSCYWVKASICSTFDSYGNHTGYTAIRQDITDKKIVEEISITDGLTNIYNRRHFNEIFPRVINSAKRTNELVCFLLLDIDNFKQYNDNYGHQKGDTVLISVAQCLKDAINRADDMVFRLGGEEFGVTFQADSKEKALAFSNTLRKNIEDLKIVHVFSSASKYITASMGLVCKNANAIENMDKIYKEADDLLYVAKGSGRNRVEGNIL